MLKALAEQVGGAGGLPAVARFARRGSVLVLAYHNIVPDGEAPGADASLHLPQRLFAQQLDHLRDAATVIPLAEALRPTRRQHGPAVVITFDDAYRGAVVAGGGELGRRGMTATMFVAPAFVGGGSFWWDAVPWRERGEPGPELRRFLLESLGGEDARVRAWLAERDVSVVDPPEWARCASESDLLAARREGMRFGSHSWSHPNLEMLTGGRLAEELTRPLQWLRERFDAVDNVLAYPYGRVSAAVEDAARAAGYEAGLRIDGGWLGKRRMFSLPRLDVPAGLSPKGFVLRVSGLVT